MHTYTEQAKIDQGKIDPLEQMLKAPFRNVTPVRLRLLLVSNCVLLLLFCAMALETMRQHVHAARTVVYDAAPSVIAAYKIKMGLEQMDGHLANELLYEPGSREALQEKAGFEKCRINVCRQVIAAAKNITYGAQEQKPLENIQIGLGTYLTLAQDARYKRTSDAALATDSYLTSLRTLRDQIIPNANALNSANAEVLEATYAAEKSNSAMMCSLVLVLGMLLFFMLFFTQIYLRVRFRRRLNVPLIIASLSTLLVVNHLYAELRSSAAYLKVAKEDSYDSLFALLAAQISAYDADAAQSRWLLDRQHKDEHAKTFLGAVNSIAGAEAGYDLESIIKLIEKQIEAGENLTLQGFKGTLADEFRNITFTGERDAALEAVAALQTYTATDAKMRALDKSGSHTEAERLALGYRPTECKFSFVKLDDALNRLLRINQTHFKDGAKAAIQELQDLDWVVKVFFLLIACCVYIGLRPRMYEYLK